MKTSCRCVLVAFALAPLLLAHGLAGCDDGGGDDGAATAQCDGEAPAPEPWDTGEEDWICSTMWGACEEGFSPCACVDCCPVSYYVEGPRRGSGAYDYYPQLPGVVVRLPGEPADLPNTFQATWDDVEAPTETLEGRCAFRPTDTTACGQADSVLILGREGEDPVRLALSVPQEILAGVEPDGPVTVHLLPSQAATTGDSPLGSVEIVDEGSGRLLLAAHAHSFYPQQGPYPHDLAGQGEWSVAVGESHCSTLPDSCNRLMEVRNLRLTAGEETWEVAPEETVDVDLGTATYRLHHARTVRRGASPRGGGGGCTDLTPTVVDFWLVLQPQDQP